MIRKYMKIGNELKKNNINRQSYNLVYYNGTYWFYIRCIKKINRILR